MVRYTAKQFIAPSSAEVSGIILMAYLNNLAKDITEPILRSYNFEMRNMDVDQWYPNQMFLDIEKAIYDSPGGTEALVAIGKSAAENYIPPQSANALEEAILSLPDVYKANQRNLPKGYGWIIEKKGHNHYHFINNTGTTNHGAYGYVFALCRRLAQPGQRLQITPLQGFDEGSTEPGIFEIKW